MEQKQFVITLEQLTQMAAAVNGLAQQIGAGMTAPLLAQLNALTARPIASAPETANAVAPNGEERSQPR